jgi:hypothetical protein
MPCNKIFWASTHISANRFKIGAVWIFKGKMWHPLRAQGGLHWKTCSVVMRATAAYTLVSTLEHLLNVDTSVTHPAMASTRINASKIPGAAAEECDKARKRHHHKNCTQDYPSVPLSVETYGRVRKDAEGLLKDMTEWAASTGACEFDCFLHLMRRETSLSSIRNGASVLQAPRSADQRHWG